MIRATLCITLIAFSNTIYPMEYKNPNEYTTQENYRRIIDVAERKIIEKTRKLTTLTDPKDIEKTKRIIEGLQTTKQQFEEKLEPIYIELQDLNETDEELTENIELLHSKKKNNESYLLSCFKGIFKKLYK